MAFSTGISLLSVGGRSVLTYSTSTINNSNWAGISATALPNPDAYGVTGFANTGTTGMSVTSGNARVLTDIVGTYPNYQLTVYLNPANDHLNTSVSTTLTPVIKDSAGVKGDTSGVLTVNALQRIMGWTGDTSYTTTAASDSTSVIWGVGIGSGNGGHYTGFARSNNTVSSTDQRGNWVNIPFGALGEHYEVKYVVTGVSGSASVNISRFNGGVLATGYAENTYYDVRSSSNNTPVLRIYVTEGNSATVNFTVTIRNKINTSMVLSQALSLTFNNT